MHSVPYAKETLVMLVGYALGCFTSGYYLVRWRTGEDIRWLGSGSVGATNVGRVLGRPGFFLTVLCDFFKGLFAVWLAEYFGLNPTGAVLTLVAVAISPVLLVLSQVYRPRLRRQSREAKNLEHSALAVVQEALGALRVVKAFGREDHEENRYVRQSREGMRTRLRLALDQGRYGLFISLTTAAGMAAVLWIGVLHVQAKAFTLGDLLLVMGPRLHLAG